MGYRATTDLTGRIHLLSIPRATIQYSIRRQAKVDQSMTSKLHTARVSKALRACGKCCRFTPYPTVLTAVF